MSEVYLYIANAGVDEHINHIRKELRFIELLRDNIRLLYQQADVPLEVLTLLRQCDAETAILAHSFQWKIDFLRSFNEDIQRMSGEIDLIIDDMNAAIDRSIM